MGNLSVIPENRSWKVVFVGVDNTTVKVEADGEAVEGKVTYCSVTSSMTVEIPETSVEKEIRVIFEDGITLTEGNLEERCYKLLEKAQMEYDMKFRIMENIKKQGRNAVATIAAMGLNPAVFGELCEILTA